MPIRIVLLAAVEHGAYPPGIENEIEAREVRDHGTRTAVRHRHTRRPVAARGASGRRSIYSGGNTSLVPSK